MADRITINFGGRLGNLMYEIATVLATAWRNGMEPVFCTEHEKGYYNDQPSYVNYVKPIISQFGSIETLPQWNQYHENVREEPKQLIFTENTVLRGYFNSPIYFNDYKTKIIELFTQRDKEEIASMRDDLRKTTPYKIVCMHVRRADYVTDYNWALPLEYYINALEYFKALYGQFTLFVFTDDKKWCISNIPKANVMNLKDVQEIQLMGQFDGLIISNSTFSSWAAMLGQQLNVVAPDVWRDDKGGLDPYNKWIYEPHWIRV